MRKIRGFTLVELLVVIAIIALLISILLPSLGKARAQANLVADKANFKQVANAVLMYSGEYKGQLPFASIGNITGVPGGKDMWGTDGYGNGTNGVIYHALSLYLGRRIDNQNVGPISPVFLCTEALTPEQGIVWAPGYVRTMRFHPRAFPGHDSTITPEYKNYPQRKISSIKNAAEKIMAWDGPQLLTWNMCPEDECINLDGWRWNWGHCYTDPPTNSYDQAHMAQTLDQSEGAINGDPTGWWGACCVRYRHIKNTTTPVLFFDGHVEDRHNRLVNGVKVSDIRVREICITPSK